MNHEMQIRKADEAMDNVDPDASDEIIAGVVADYYLDGFRSSGHLAIMHDVRPSTQRKVERIRKRFERPDYQPVEPYGTCPLPYDWSYKNTVGVSTRNRKRARQWCIDAMLAGYDVSRSIGSHRSGGFGQGTITQIRARRREEIAQEKTRQERAANADPKVSATMTAMFNKLMGD